MCGDYGLSYELFRCKLCQFRSQHRYCSNLYPKAESYRVCNWCLNQKDDPAGDKAQNSSNSSSSPKSNSTNEEHHHHGVVKLKKAPLQIKKQKSPEQSPKSSSRKRINVTMASESMEERLRRTKSEELLNGSGAGTTKPVLIRNKVRRYKLLDEVSS